MTMAPERTPTQESDRPSDIPNWPVVVLATVVMALVGTGLIFLFVRGTGDGVDSGERIRGSGDITTQTRPVGDFDGVTLMSGGRLLITQGTEESLTIETDDNLMPFLETEVSGGELRISAEKDGTSYNLDPSGDIIFRIGVIDLRDITVYGGGDFEMGTLTTAQLDLEVFGAADVVIDDLSADQLRINVPGTADITLSGAVGSQEVRWIGAGTYTGGELRSETAVVSVTGAATVEMWVTDDIDITVTGAGTVNYYGTPTVTQNVTGVATVRGLGLK